MATKYSAEDFVAKCREGGIAPERALWLIMEGRASRLERIAERLERIDEHLGQVDRHVGLASDA